MEDVLDKANSDLMDLVVPIVRGNPTWDDMFDVFNQVMENNIDEPIKQLERIRFITDQTEDAVLSSTARLLGFDLSQDVLNLNADNLIKLVSQLPLYADQNGTDLFVKFIDLMFNAHTQVQNLYTKDYVNFVPVPEGKLVIDGGEWFKTTHVDLSIELLKSDEIVLNDGVRLIDRIRELFFNLAPVALVVYRTNFTESIGETEIAFGAYMPYMEVSVTIE